MSFLKTLEYMFRTQDLYVVLGVDKGQPDRAEAVQAAFDMKALRYRPDKRNGNKKKYEVRLL